MYWRSLRRKSEWRAVRRKPVIYEPGRNRQQFPTHAVQCGLVWRHGIFAGSGPGSFYRTQAYRTVGGIRHDLHYVMDNELYMRMMLRGVRFVYIDRYLAVFRRHPGQKNTAARDLGKAEAHKLTKELKTHGITYRSAQSLLLYYAWQAVSGNYVQKRLHALRARGKYWRAWARQAFNAPEKQS